ncbi:unconventional myosin-Va-like isoform X2 [Ornithodoros turicata]|uniref:unconventional myosin-Va-like isoform X2 n=1 Tax=Ornithodoros turicata TaxID=34597 RepID=UPI003139AC62
MSSLVLYTKGARVWLPDPADVWKAGVVSRGFDGKTLEVESEDGQHDVITITNPDKLPPLRNPEVLIGGNDLTSLSYLHEPGVLHNLQVRFCNNNVIYTYCGIILVAINPYEELPIYGNDTIFAYRGQAMGDLDPHIFAVSEEAYTKMERENMNQSIIVSGESGAGKTVSAKYGMRYFATVGGSSTETHIEKKVLASNPIMEAIGNAKTTRNDNSSRFGKYIEIDFNTKFNIIGANMRTYLLEKSRVVFQAPDERNYHIFYQLCASADLDELQDLQLGSQTMFHYTNQGESPTIAGVDDAHAFQTTRNAFTLLGFTEQQQMMIFRILASILHLGNVTLVHGGAKGDDTECCMVQPGDLHVTVMADLLGIDCDQISVWLCNRKIESMREVITKPMTVDQAVFARDALAKHVYARLFDWIVTRINKALASKDKVFRFIGVLDIYGFETFEVNSFEQFCINYANEKLQQQFNLHVFKLEQEEYVREQIEWKFIDFYDNQPSIDLIESKLGVLDLLDEECRVPKGTDQTWCMKLYEKCKKWKHFEKPRLSNTAFIIHHFADDVTYESQGFLEKNRDTVLEEHINILKASQYELVAELFEDERASRKNLKPSVKITPAQSAPSSKKQHKKTVGSQFRDSLGLLMNTLNATSPHYVRCIKPNDQKAPFTFDTKRAVQQLRACGVLETVRISAAGYPSRWGYQEFLTRYRVLTCAKDIDRSDLRTTCQKILDNVIKEEDKFQFGKTKIFFRAGQVAYLEKLRAEKHKACALMIQTHIRGFLQFKRYQEIRRSALGLQVYGRGMLARRHAHFLRCTRAATTIQKYCRGYLARTHFQNIRRIVIHMQCYVRGLYARQRFRELQRNAAATVIQKNVRCWLARKSYQREHNSIIVAQSAVRRWFAKREMRKLKIEARSVEHVKMLNKGLEKKIISLQQKIEEIMKENRTLRAHEQDMRSLSEKLEQAKNVENVLRESNNKVAELQDTLASVQSELKHALMEKEDWRKKCNSIKEEAEVMKSEKIKLKEDLDATNELIKANKEKAEETLQMRLENERHLLLAEFDEERSAYQRLLKERDRLEQRCENLMAENIRVRGVGGGLGHHRTPSNVSMASVHSDAETVQLDASDTDMGYGSARVKDKESSHLKLDAVAWPQQTTGVTVERSPGSDKSPGDLADVSVVLKLQQRLKEVEQEKARLEKKVEGLEAREERSKERELSAKELMRLHELEMENAKLKDEVKRMVKTLANEDKSSREKDFMAHYESIQDELERRREECLQLRAALANQSEDTKSMVSLDSYRGNLELVNEDGELLMAFETQKQLIRQLESELYTEKTRMQSIENDYREEMRKLKEDNDRQQKLLSQNLKKTPQAQSDAILQHEINRLTAENVDLREKIDSLGEQLKKSKRQIKIYAKKLKDHGILDQPGDAKAEAAEEHGKNMPEIKHKDTEHLGMFEYKKEEVPLIVKSLITDLKPKVAITLLPGLPAYILFMCIRHTDYVNDAEKVQTLLNDTVFGIRKVVKRRHEDIDYTVLWLANTCRFMHNLKQYSGEKQFQVENTPKQNEQCLRNFDLSQYRQVMSDIAVWIYQAVIKCMEEKVQPLIVPAVLEHEAIAGISGNKPSGMRSRASSTARELDSPVDPQRALDVLVKELNNFYKVLLAHGVDPELITQVFKQLFYFVCAGALNNLLLRKDMCHWSKGMQMRYNLSHLEQWCRDQKMSQSDVLDTLQPIIQASQLLQARKTDDDVNSVCDMCDKLTTAQIIKILNLYTPADDYEERVPVSFIRKVQAKLKERNQETLPVSDNTLLMDTKFSFPIRFPFNPSKIQLEDINIPDILNLAMLRKI